MPPRSTNNILSLKHIRKDDSLIEICFRIMNHVDAMLAYWDRNEVCKFANKAYIRWAGKSGSELIGKMKMKEFLGPLYRENRPYIKKVLAGKKQVFERDHTIHSGPVRHYIVTYSPDIIKGGVVGFFVHVADINPIKDLEAKLLNYEKAKRREVLRSVIETQETERELISYELRDKVNQTLASAKMMLDTADSTRDGKALFAMISRNIHEAIDELNRISTDLTPTVIIMIGLLAGVKEYINSFKSRHSLRIHFNCSDKGIEKLAINDKISLFRIIQSYLLLLSHNRACKTVNIEIRRLNSKIILQMQNNCSTFKLPLHSKEFVDIEHRLEYYDGIWKHFSEKNKKTLSIELHIPL
jgi:PAS domain S-box-containing protein